MSEMIDRQRAIHDYMAFVSDHRASKARHVPPTAEDLPPVESIEVSRADAMKAFFELHPEHGIFRLDVSHVFEDQQLFSFSKERWEKTTRKLAKAKPK